MTAVEADRTGVMIVRIWLESAHEQGLRARLTESSDLASRKHVSHAAASVDEIVGTVRRWAERFSNPVTPR